MSLAGSMKLIKCLVIVIFITLADANYCALSCDTGPNIACNHNNNFDRSCPPNAKMIPITGFMKQLLVDLHNEKRNLIAGGGVAKYKPACRMATMQWDDELAFLAGLNVKKCYAAHESCRRTSRFEYPGQNIAELWQSPPRGYNVTEKFVKIVDAWYDEGKYCTPGFMKKYPEFYQGPKIGHFATMMLEGNMRLGCAASQYIKNSREYILVTCDYASMVVRTGTVYSACGHAGSECSTGTNPLYRNLCSTAEYNNVNN